MMRFGLAAVGFLVFGLHPVAAQEREWSLATAGEDVFLVFGVPETTDIGISFWCKTGAQDVSVFSPVVGTGPRKDKYSLTLAIDGLTFHLTEGKGGDSSGGTVEALLKPQDKILAALEKADHVSLTVGKHTSTFPLDGADFKGLLETCANPAVEPAD